MAYATKAAPCNCALPAKLLQNMKVVDAGLRGWHYQILES